MRALEDGRLPLENETVKHIDLCLGCRACEAACPSGVEYGHLLEHARDHVEKKYSRSIFQTALRRFAIEKIFPFPFRMKLALLPARLIKALKLQWMLPKPLRESLELIGDNTESGQLPEISTANKKRGRVGFIEGCVMQVMFARTNRNSVRLLNDAGWDVVTPKKQECCGALYAHSGQLEKARKSARHNIAVFEELNLDAIIINAAGCGSMLKEYGALLADDPKWAKRGADFSANIKDLTEWLKESDLKNQNPETKVTYHDACHLAHPQGITTAPRALVNEHGGQLIEMPEADVCCGSAGSYNLTEPEMAARLQNRKVQNIISTGANVVVTSNPGCLLQIQSGLKKAGSPIQAMHIADYLITGHGE